MERTPSLDPSSMQVSQPERQDSHIAASIVLHVPEMLLEIFAWLKECYSQKSNTAPFINRISFSQVCRFWRETAVACPSLWIDIPLHNLKWTKLALQRAKSMPLTLTIDSYALYISPDSLTCALRELEQRIAVLRITINNDRDECPQVFNTAILPRRLKELYVNFDHVPGRIFRGRTPLALKLLSVHTNLYVLRDLDHLFSSSITQFYLYPFGSGLLTIDQTLNILSHMPLLETLKLGEGVLGWVDEDDGYFRSTEVGPPHVRLAYLNSLYFGGAVDRAALLLRRMKLSAPLRGDVRFNLYTNISECEEEFLELVSELLASTHGKHRSAVSYLASELSCLPAALDTTGTPHFALKCHSSSTFALADSGLSSPNDLPLPLSFDIKIEIYSAHKAFSSLFEDLVKMACTQLPLTSVDSLSLVSVEVTDTIKEILVDKLGARVTHLQLAGVSTDGIFSGRWPSSETALHSPLPVSAFPHLRHLQIIGSEFTGPDGDRTLRDIIAYAHERRSMVNGEARFSAAFTACQIDEEAKKRLRGELGTEYVDIADDVNPSVEDIVEGVKKAARVHAKNKRGRR